MTDRRLFAIDMIARELGRDPGEVPADGTIATVPGWDSLGHIKILTALEARLGRILGPDEIAMIRGVVDIERILSAAAAEPSRVPNDPGAE